MIASEYGYTDDQIGELPLGRFRQIVSAIQLRKFRDERKENARVSWMTRTLAQFTAGGYMVAKGKNNTALEQAAELAFDDIEAALMGAETKHRGGAQENTNGSYERFMGMLGQFETVARQRSGG